MQSNVLNQCPCPRGAPRQQWQPQLYLQKPGSSSETASEKSRFTPPTLLCLQCHCNASLLSASREPAPVSPQPRGPCGNSLAWPRRASFGSLQPPYLCPRPQSFHYRLVSQLPRVPSRPYGPCRVGGLQPTRFCLPQPDLCLATFGISCLFGRTSRSRCRASPRPKSSGVGGSHLRNPSAATS